MSNIKQFDDVAPKKRILYLVTQGAIGGPRTHINHLIEHLKHKLDIHVAVGFKDCLPDYLEDRSIPLYRIPSLERPIAAIKDTKALTEIISLIRKIKPDLISTHSSKAGVLGRLAARYCRIPVIFTAHGWSFTEGVPEGQRRLYALIERNLAPLTDKIICVSEHDYQLALQLGVGKKEQLEVIQNCLPYYPDASIANPAGNNPVNLIMVARFSEQKDHLLLFEALQKLGTKYDYKLKLVGDGPLLKLCKEKAAEFGLNGKVEFLEERTDVPELLVGSHLFLLISKWEGLPRSVLEAMRAGLPVIASDVGGTREAVIDGETGYLIPRGDQEALTDRIQRLIANPELRIQMGVKGLAYFRSRFSFESLVKKTFFIYYEVMERKSMVFDKQSRKVNLLH